MLAGSPAFAQRPLGQAHADGVVVGPAAAAAQHEVAVGGCRACGRSRCGPAALMPRKLCGCARRPDRVDRDVEAAVGAVLEPDRRRQAARHLAVRLRLGRARADRVPADQVARGTAGESGSSASVAGRQAHLRELRPAGGARARDALVDAEGVVHARIVDVPLPAGRGARLLEVDAHHHEAACRRPPSASAREPRGIVERGRRIVDRAGSDHDEQPRVAALEDRAQRGPAGLDRAGGRGRDRRRRVHVGGRRHRIQADDVDVLEGAVALRCIRGGHRRHAGVPRCRRSRAVRSVSSLFAKQKRITRFSTGRS